MPVTRTDVREELATTPPDASSGADAPAPLAVCIAVKDAVAPHSGTSRFGVQRPAGSPASVSEKASEDTHVPFTPLDTTTWSTSVSKLVEKKDSAADAEQKSNGRITPLKSLTMIELLLKVDRPGGTKKSSAVLRQARRRGLQHKQYKLYPLSTRHQYS
jgi:hypothetical protein